MTDTASLEVATTLQVPVVAGALAVGGSTQLAPGLRPPWKPGESGNPSGRPKSFAHLIREQTGEGRELVEFALKMLRNVRQEPRYRLEALEWLADRGWGKPVQSHELMGEGGGAVVFTLRLGERDADRDD